MAKETLSTSYKNDIMNSTMGGKRRFNLIDNGDGTVSLEDATKYDQKGTDFTATDLNKITKAVNASADAGKIIDDKDSILATTAKGYMAGALGVKNLLNELNSNIFDVSEMLNKTFIVQVRTSDYKMPLFGQIKKLKFRGTESDRSYIIYDQNGTNLATAGTSEVTVDVTDVLWCHFAITNGSSSVVYVTFLE